MKTIYIVEYWLPFPSSEYGGVDIVIADNKKEALELLVKDVSDFDKEHYPEYQEMIAEKVANALRYKVQATKSEIVLRFNT